MNQNSSYLNLRISSIRWALPISLALGAIVYQLVIARWVHDSFGDSIHFGIEILFFASVGPLLAFLALTLMMRWFEEKNRVENRAQIVERRLASITAASVDAILSTNPRGVIEDWNKGAELLFGYTESEIRGRPLSDILKSEAGASVELYWLLHTVQASGYLQGHETICSTASGEEIVVELTATDLADSEGRSSGISIILRDITQRKEREAEIQRLNASLNQQVADRTRELAEKVDELAEANRNLQKLDQMRSEFVSLVSHQIRAPLTNMRGSVERMQTGCGAINATCSRMFLILEEEVDRLDELVQDVLSVARIESGKLSVQLEPLSILPVIQKVIERARARDSSRDIQFPTKPGLPLVLADRDHISEILMNLLDNADKYSLADCAITVDVRANQREVGISVLDEGPGIPEEDLERVFEKYHRNDNSDSQAVYGTGLGLYICRNLVEAQGGRIWAENRPDGGARFSFTLPVFQENDV